MRPSWTDTQTRHRDRLMRLAYPRILAGAHAQLRRRHAAYSDIDLSLEDLTQLGAEKASVRYVEIFDHEPLRYVDMADDEMIEEIVARGLWAVHCAIVDIIRKRIQRRKAAEMAPPLPDQDDSDLRRIAAMLRLRRVEMTLAEDPRRVLQAAWKAETISARELSALTGLRREAIYSAIRDVRAAARRDIDIQF